MDLRYDEVAFSPLDQLQSHVKVKELQKYCMCESTQMGCATDSSIYICRVSMKIMSLFGRAND